VATVNLLGDPRPRVEHANACRSPNAAPPFLLAPNRRKWPQQRFHPDRSGAQWGGGEVPFTGA
jgi:hypothetical protein